MPLGYRAAVRLMATTNAMVSYPDRASSGISCIEVRSAASRYGHEVLRDEILGLSAASLLIQLELGMPVVKLLNVTDVVWGDPGSGQPGELAEPILNCLGMYASDKADFQPQQAVERALAHASPLAQEHFAAAPATLDRYFRFLGAVGAADADGALLSPWVHVSLDRAEEPGGRSEAVLRAALSPSLVSQALWWQPHVTEGGDRLFRTSHRRAFANFEAPDQVLVPLPFAREADEHVVAGRVNERAIRSVGGAPSTVGFSVTLPVDPDAPRSDHGAGIIRAALDATARFVDARDR